jgi:nucleoside-diphosphate-sugar epimerase
MRRALVCGAGGFVGTHMVSRLKAEGAWVRGVDLKAPAFSTSAADEFAIADLRDRQACRDVFDQPFDEVYQLAADMGGAGYVFSGDHDAQIMVNSAAINTSIADAAARARIGTLFFPSSACVYPAATQLDPRHPRTSEVLAYPAQPANEYGWEKLFAERLYAAQARAGKFAVRIARFHTLFGPLGEWRGVRAKAVAALCRKAAEAPDGGAIEVWGDGEQTRSFLFIDDALDGVGALMRSTISDPINIGSEELVSIRALASMIAGIAGKRLAIHSVPGPEGVRGRTSDNTIARRELGWSPHRPLIDGLRVTYAWIASQIHHIGTENAALRHHRTS